MAEYIERSAIMRRIEQEAFRWGEEYDLQQILGDIEDAPTADVVKVRRGQWIEDSLVEAVTCSLCGHTDYTFNYDRNEWGSNYCPNCGARMVINYTK